MVIRIGSRIEIWWNDKDTNALNLNANVLSFQISNIVDYKEGFGGKFGVQADRQDKSAVGWDHLEAKQQHDSQKGRLHSFLLCPTCFTSAWFCLDYKTGFGGKFGVQKDRVDKSAVGWEHHEKVDKHESQKGEFGCGQ